MPTSLGPNPVNLIALSPAALMADRTPSIGSQGFDVDAGFRSGMDLYLIGIGTAAADGMTAETDAVVLQQLTPQALAALQSCETIYHLTLFDLALRKLLQPNVQVIDLNNDYQAKSSLSVAIDEATNTVDAAAMSAKADDSGPVAYVTYGTPMYGDSISFNLIDRNEQRSGDDRLAIQIVPGVSSFDTVAADLLLNAAAGMQIHDAIHLVTFDYGIESRLPMLITQLDVYSMTVQGNLTGMQAPGNRLSDVLVAAYGDDHPVHLRRSYTGQRASESLTTVVQQLDDPTTLSTIENAAMTAYVPPLI